MILKQHTERRRKFGPRSEAVLWLAGLVVVSVADPTAPALIDVCLLKAAGFTFCPGCGLGHAVGFLARGEVVLAIQTHPLSPIVVGILLHRIITLFRHPGFRSCEAREKTLNYVQGHQISA